MPYIYSTVVEYIMIKKVDKYIRNGIVEFFNSNIIYYGSRLAVKTQRRPNELFYCKLPSQDINVLADVQYIKVIFLEVFAVMNK